MNQQGSITTSVGGMQSFAANWIAAMVWIVTLMLIWTGCTRKKIEEEYILRVGPVTLSLSEFNQAVKAAGEEAFAGEQAIEAGVMNDLRIRVLNQLSEEMMIAAFAADRGIVLSADELDRAIADIKADYPDNTFEETLLENAVSFPFWRNQLASRLLIKKVIDQELIQTVQITTDDIARYYKTHYPQGLPEGQNTNDINQRIVTHLRMQKAEVAYKGWIEQLRNSYPVEVNQQMWDKTIGDNRKDSR